MKLPIGIIRLYLFFVMVALLAGCGGGSGGGGVPGVTILALPSGVPISGVQTVPPNETSLFEITGLTPGTAYSVSIAGFNIPELAVFDDSGLVDRLCTSVTPTSIGSCSAVPSGTSLFLRVTASALGDSVTLDVAQVSVTVLDFASLPATGQTVPANEDRLFEITGLTAGTIYSVSIAGSKVTGLSVYGEPGLTEAACNLFTFTGSGSCSGIASSPSLFLRIASSESGNTFTLDVTEVPAITLPLTSLPESGQTVAPNGIATFVVTGLEAETIYSVTTTGTNNINLTVYDDAGLINDLCASFTSTSNESCNATPSGTELFLRVSDSSGSGATFDLDVGVAPVITLPLADLPGAGTGQAVSANGETLFEITGLVAGTIYSVSIAGSSANNLFVYDDPGLVNELCFSFNSTGNGNCGSSPSGTSFYLRVSDTSASGGSFNLDVTLAPVITLPLANLPGAGTGQTVSAGGSTLFGITGIAAGTIYDVSIAGSSATSLFVYDDPGFANLLCGSFISTGSGGCSATPTGTTLFLRVEDASGSAGSFDLGVTEVPVIKWPLASLPVAAVTASGIALFEIAGLAAGTIYNVSITGTTETSLLVYDDPGLTSQLCSTPSATGTKSCSATPSGTSLFLRVDDFSGSADTFTLDVTETPVTTLTLTSLPGAGVGQTVSPNGTTLYEITGFVAGTIYDISIAGSSANRLSTYNDPDLTDNLCSSFNSAGVGGCSATPSGASIFLRVDDFSGSGDTFDLDVIVTPVIVLQLTSVPSVQTVSSGGIKLFQISGLDAGGIYDVSITGTNATSLSVYDDPGLTDFLCESLTFTGIESCSATPSGTSLFLRVRDESGLGDTFSLNVTGAPP